MATAKKQPYTVLEPLLHDGDKYVPGQPIELTAAQAKSMQSRQLVGELLKSEATAEDTTKEGAE